MSDIQEFKCPACGGALEFDSATQLMKCPYCDSTYAVSELDGTNEENRRTGETRDFEWNREQQQWTGEETNHMCVFVCESCGGEIIGDENTGATTCPYCGNKVVLKERFSGDLRPDYVIPFQLDKEAAKKAYLKHLEKKTLLPKLFREKNHIDEIKGVYVPFWLYDADVEASASFTGTKVRHWSDSRYNYTETSYYDVVRSGHMSFSHIPVDGSTQMADDLMESIEPFDFSKAVDFNTAYLAGFFADKYDLSEDKCEARANERINSSALSILNESANSGGYATLKPEGDLINMKKGGVGYALYPVYLLSSTYDGQKYTFAMNGQTGKFVGDLPMDKKKYWGMFLGLTAGISAVVSALMWLLF